MKVKYKDFEKYRSKLLGYSYRLLNRYSYSTNVSKYQDSKDIVQDTYFNFHKLVKSKFEFKNEEHIWNTLKLSLFRTMINNHVDIRSKRVQNNKEEANDMQIFPSNLHPKTVILNGIIANLDRQILMSRLNKDQKFIYNKLESGYNKTEIASELEISKQAVRDRCLVMINKLKSYEEK